MEKMTMKKYIIFIASAVLMMAACAKEEVNTTVTGETELITIQLTPATKTALSNDGTHTTWTVGDKVRVTVNGVFGDLELVDETKGTFRGELPTAGFSGDLTATINYPAGVTEVPSPQTAVAGSFADEAALLEGSTTLAALRDGKGPKLSNMTALLQFEVAQAGDVTFEVGDTEYTVTGCMTGNIYYACVKPASNVDLSYKIGSAVGEKSKSDVTFKANLMYELGTIDILKYNVYVCISDLGWNSVNMHRFKPSGDLTAWPGESLSETVTVNQRTYYKKSIAADETLSFTYNNGDAPSNFKIDVPNVTVSKDIYYRLSARGAIEVDPNDVKTFGYAIYVFDQKSKNVAPNLYAWNDNNAWKNTYGGNFSSWPGVAFNKDCYYVPANGENWKHYYYYEIPTSLYNQSFMFIVNKTGQTSDLSVTNLAGDLYVGYWYDSASSNGFWANTNLNTPITE